MSALEVSRPRNFYSTALVFISIVVAQWNYQSSLVDLRFSRKSAGCLTGLPARKRDPATRMSWRAHRIGTERACVGNGDHHFSLAR